MPTPLHSGGASLTTGGYATSDFLDDLGVAPPSMPIFETWTAAADGINTMSGDYLWTPFVGGNLWGVESHALKLENSGSAAHGGRIEIDLGTSDHRVSAEVTEFAHPGTGTLVASVAARMQGTAAMTFYAWDMLAVTGSYKLLLLKFVAGVQTDLQDLALPGAPTGTNLLELDVLGSTVRAFYNHVLRVVVTDTSIPVGQFAGVQGVANGAGNRTRMDNFSVRAAIGAGTGGSHRRRFFGLAPLTGVR